MASLVIFFFLVGAILAVSNPAMVGVYVSLIILPFTILPLLILEAHKAYNRKRFLGKLTALTECPALDVWNYEDSEGDFHHFVAWELTVIDRYGMAMRYRAGAEDRQGALRVSPDARDGAGALRAGST